MTVWVCRGCSAAYAVGLSRCPQCHATEWDEQGRVEYMAKIRKQGGATYTEDEAPSAEATESTEPAEAEAELVSTMAEAEEAVAAAEAAELQRPADSDLKSAWVAYAVAKGHDQADAELATKAELIRDFG